MDFDGALAAIVTAAAAEVRATLGGLGAYRRNQEGSGRHGQKAAFKGVHGMEKSTLVA